MLWNDLDLSNTPLWKNVWDGLKVLNRARMKKRPEWCDTTSWLYFSHAGPGWPKSSDLRSHIELFAAKLNYETTYDVSPLRDGKTC